MSKSICVDLYSTRYPLYRDPSGKEYACIGAVMIPDGQDEFGRVYFTSYVLLDTYGNVTVYEEEAKEFHTFTSEEDLMKIARVAADDPKDILVATEADLFLLVPPVEWHFYDRVDRVWLDPLTAATEILDNARKVYKKMLEEKEANTQQRH